MERNRIANRKDGLLNCLGNQAGAGDLVVLALALPIILVAIAAAVDLSRVPVARNRVLSALMSATYNVERDLFQADSTKVIDPYLPAGNNLCTYTPSGGSCAVTSLGQNQGFLSSSMASLIVNQACTSSGALLSSSASGLFNFGSESSEFGLKFGLIQLQAEEAEGEVSEVKLLGSSADECAGTLLSTTPKLIDFEEFGENIAKQFKSAGMTPGTWNILGLPGEGSVDRRAWIDSYWLVGVGLVEVQHMFGQFFGQKTLVKEYFIRPLNVPAGIQDAGQG